MSDGDEQVAIMREILALQADMRDGFASVNRSLDRLEARLDAAIATAKKAAEASAPVSKSDDDS